MKMCIRNHCCSLGPVGSRFSGRFCKFRPSVGRGASSPPPIFDKVIDKMIRFGPIESERDDTYT